MHFYLVNKRYLYSVLYHCDSGFNFKKLKKENCLPQRGNPVFIQSNLSRGLPSTYKANSMYGWIKRKKQKGDSFGMTCSAKIADGLGRWCSNAVTMLSKQERLTMSLLYSYVIISISSLYYQDLQTMERDPRVSRELFSRCRLITPDVAKPSMVFGECRKI